jgi:hypothetical protein
MSRSTGTRRTASVGASSKSSNTGRGPGYVLCLDNRGYAASLQVGKVYRRLRPRAGDANFKNWIRVVDESGDNYLFPGVRFAEVEIPPRAKRALAAAG